jgi:hypothetical protein
LEDQQVRKSKIGGLAIWQVIRSLIGGSSGWKTADRRIGTSKNRWSEYWQVGKLFIRGSAAQKIVDSAGQKILIGRSKNRWSDDRLLEMLVISCLKKRWSNDRQYWYIEYGIWNIGNRHISKIVIGWWSRWNIGDRQVGKSVIGRSKNYWSDDQKQTIEQQSSLFCLRLWQNLKTDDWRDKNLLMITMV